MDPSDLQTIESFNAQCSDVADKVQLLINYLRECVALAGDNKELVGQMARAAQAGIVQFDIYIFIDFVEEAQVLQLQQIIQEVTSFFSEQSAFMVNDPENDKLFLEQLSSYLGICESRLAFINELASDPAKNKYQLLFQQHNNANNNAQTQPAQSEPLPPFNPIRIVQNSQS